MTGLARETLIGTDPLLLQPAEEPRPGSRKAVALVLITDPEATAAETAGLTRGYQFTEAESAVAMLLAKGASVAEIAHLRSVSRETVRTQIKSALSKMGGRRQSDLVRLVTALSAAQADG